MYGQQKSFNDNTIPRSTVSQGLGPGPLRTPQHAVPRGRRGAGSSSRRHRRRAAVGDARQGCLERPRAPSRGRVAAASAAVPYRQKATRRLGLGRELPARLPELRQHGRLSCIRLDQVPELHLHQRIRLLREDGRKLGADQRDRRDGRQTGVASSSLQLGAGLLAQRRVLERDVAVRVPPRLDR